MIVVIIILIIFKKIKMVETHIYGRLNGRMSREN